jgi:hypothetical protein
MKDDIKLSTIIAGGREYQFTNEDCSWLDTLLIREVVSGCAKGADTCGENWAKSKNIPIKRFPADWEKHGKSAGPIRNIQMAEYAEALALFPGGSGTRNMLKEATKRGLKIFLSPSYEKNV